MPNQRGGFWGPAIVIAFAVSVVLGTGAAGTAAAQSSGSALPDTSIGGVGSTGSAAGQGFIGPGSLTDGTGSDGTGSNGTNPITGSWGTASLARSAFGSWIPGAVGSLVPEPDLAPPPLETLRAGMLPAPVGDPFFDDYPAGLPGMANGQVIETRDVTPVARGLLRGPVREVRQMKVKSTDSSGAPSFATATLVVPATPWPGPGPRPVLVNNVPINSLGRACTPSHTLAYGITPSTNFLELIRPVTTRAEERGYAVLIVDHEGPRMAYGEPYVAGHAILDSIRGMRSEFPAEFGASRLAMMGYSGGSIATHGAVKLIDSYAPELASDIVGAAMGGVPADFEMLGRTMNGNLAGGLFLAAAFGISRENTEILPLINGLGRRAGLSSIKDQCMINLGASGVLGIPAEALANIPDALDSDVAQDIYAKTKMADLTSGTPLYIYNGGQEFWIPALGARNLFDEQCGHGVAAVYRQVPGEHFLGEALGNPGAFDWVDARLRGEPAPSEC
ncbi:lipase family protein [Rhodococcus sp. SGAir0479]|uniref:lipase family protein n=1 Tax=Rhodococcus sp. SGAir0479 TaxID=2567884 RepID=UPI0010CCB58B|nr:lipase family protein [Rhodococcus sp. SGAir0479]QCQ93007.1 lipase [Rhodococcus sp. SGAir0479]